MDFAAVSLMKSWFNESKNTICDAKKFILFSFLVFHLGIILGYYYLSTQKFIGDNYIELYDKTYSPSYLIYVSRILVHNVTVAYLSMRLGILLGLFPAISVIVSGISIGWLFANSTSVHWVKLFLMMAPHGVFELPAMFIAWGIGFWRCKMLFVPNYEKMSKENVRQVHKIFITFVVPLLFLAALIEGGPLLF